MTLPQDVADAVQLMDLRFTSSLPIERASMRNHEWQTIRAHLMSQEAEITRLTSRSESAERDCRDYRQIQIEDSVRAELAESRLAAANALLREAIGWNWLDDGASRPDVMDVLDQAIQSHLQGAGDE